MSFPPRLVATVICGTAALQTTRPDGITRCGQHLDAGERRRHECQHRDRHHGSGRIK